MRLHVLAGPAGLLGPVPLEPALAPLLLGPQVRLAAARWLATAEASTHDFLQVAAGDARLATFARALRQDFGRRFEPLLVLPGLLAEAAGAPTTPARGRIEGLAVLERLWAEGAADGIRLVALALPAARPDGIWAGSGDLLAPGVGAGLEALRAGCVARGLPAAALELRLVEVGPNPRPNQRPVPLLAVPWRNAFAARLAAEIAGRLAAEGLALDPAAAELALARRLEAWAAAGVQPVFDPERQAFERLAARALDDLLAGALPDA